MKFLNEHLEACFIVPLMFLMSIIIFVQVVMRYVFHSSLTWSEEMARYLFVWLVYFSVAYTAKKEAHIRIDAAINIYPKKARPYVEILSEIIDWLLQSSLRQHPLLFSRRSQPAVRFLPRCMCPCSSYTQHLWLASS